MTTKKFVNCPLPEEVANEVDARRGIVKRSTYVTEIIKRAWAAGINVK